MQITKNQTTFFFYSAAFFFPTSADSRVPCVAEGSSVVHSRYGCGSNQPQCGISLRAAGLKGREE